MKKEEKIEINYVKRSTTIAIAITCLVVGVMVGLFIDNLESGPKVRKMTVKSQPQAQIPSAMPQVKPQAPAITSLEQTVAQNPKDADALAQLGNAYFDSGQFTKAIDAYKKHLELKPGSANVWTDLGVMYRRSGQPREAIAAFDKAITLDPGHEQCRFNKGVVLLHDLKDNKGALEAWQELLKVNPNAMAPNGQSVKVMVDSLMKTL